MPSPSATDERNATETTPLPRSNRNRTRRLVALYALLALLAVVIGVAVGVHRHDATSSGGITTPTERSLIATAPPGLPTPTPLANGALTLTPVSPSEPPPTTFPPTVLPPTPVPPTAPPTPPHVVVAPVQPAPPVTTNQDGQDGKSTGKGKGKKKGD